MIAIAAVIIAPLARALNQDAAALAVGDQPGTAARLDPYLAALGASGKARLPSVPADCKHNGHLYYLLLPDQSARDGLIARLGADGVSTVFHYVPLHSAPAGLRYARTQGSMSVTDETSAGLVRLPLHAGMTLAEADRVIERVYAHLSG